MANVRTVGPPQRSAGVVVPLSLGAGDLFALFVSLILLVIAAFGPRARASDRSD